ncbi:DeoR/GlpR family DNA-binding transcription regulator [Arthrobacter sp. H14-L1]|uniref:DeoR/GlpR family DNA-binding transcription regulator n=1 Tax=Arthrobacter sp. H14-L1 TaxID=2996697 RepID=UPI00227072F7|nr:DeoR/GlpR family DNA-binding transcription regulator [Arthrobacter sp. H14-L1]MCY0906577.1 DeoR/GlpR family DNA-binding transcription regulator [Arthrobacter sp. H14-L1]
MIPLERQRAILQMLGDQGSVSINSLVEALGVSHMTVRRDIHRLEEMGRVVSVLGGVSRPERLALDQSHTVKEGLKQAEKLAIAQAAVGRVQPGNVVFLDAGTTTLAIAHLLAPMPNMVFITNDLSIALSLAERSSNELFFAGGALDRANLSSDGSLTARMVAQFNVDVAFTSTSSFDLRGTSVPTDAKLAVKRAIKDSAARTILVCDSSKYGRVANLHAVKLTDIDEIITDSGLADAAVEKIKELGIPLTLADPRVDSPH